MRYFLIFVALLLMSVLTLAQSDPSLPWRNQANNIIEVSLDDLPTSLEGDPGVQAVYVPLERLRLITCAYSDMYVSNPQAYKWAGLASLVSAEIFERLLDLEEVFLLVDDVSQLYILTIQGNRAVYEDIYWQHLAYQSGGIAELQTINNEGALADEAFRAWQLIDRGLNSSPVDLNMIWEGNRRLLEYEQQRVLQPTIYDDNEDLWVFAEYDFNLDTDVDDIRWTLNSPVPNHSAPFPSSSGDFAYFDARWDWIVTEILPAWRSYEENGSNLDRYRANLTNICSDRLDISTAYENEALEQLFGELDADDIPTEGWLDLIFVIDTTGSMEDDIDQVKANALEIIDEVASNAADWRIGIVVYRDYGPPYGLENDEYVARRELEFSSSRDEVSNAIQRITIRVGAGDAPEAVYTGLIEAISFPWRAGSRKIIILMGDAPPHDPEPFSNYTSQTVLQAAYDVDPASIFPLLIASENAVRFPFQVLADGSSGKLFYAENADEVVPTLLSTIAVATGVQLSIGLDVQIASLEPAFPMRTSPSMRANVISNIPRSGRAVIIEGPEVVFEMSDRNVPQNFIWWKIRAEDGSEGWMQGTYYGEPILVPFVAETAITSVRCTLSTLRDVNVRSGPGTNYQQIASRAGEGQVLAANGQFGNINTVQDHWWQLLNGFWIRNDQVRESGDCASLPVVTLP